MAVSCSKSDDVPEKQEPPVDVPDIPDEPSSPVYPTFGIPDWSVENKNLFEHTMVFNVQVPDSLRTSEDVSDKLAVFAETECRGVAERIDVLDGKSVWMIMVYGTAEGEILNIKYYSSKTKYMYNSAGSFRFEVDGCIGTVDVPETVGMKIVMN